MTKHGFPFKPEDVVTLDHVHHIFELYGSQTGYSSNINTIDFTNGGGRNGNFTTILTTIDDQGMNRTFLATEENFQFVKRMQQKNLIIPAVGDFGGDKALRAIAEYLKDHDAIVTTFYVSNVEQYLFRPDPTSRNGGAQRFYENVAGLPLEGSSTFIRVSNNDAIKQTYPGFTTHLGSIAETLQAFKENRLQTIRDVFALSRE